VLAGFPQNMGAFLSIDEVSLSGGELLTILTYKDGKGRRGSLVAAVCGTCIRDIVGVLSIIPVEQRTHQRSRLTPVSSCSEPIKEASGIPDSFYLGLRNFMLNPQIIYMILIKILYIQANATTDGTDDTERKVCQKKINT